MEALGRLPADKFFAKYYPEREAYTLIRQFFLAHTEYTHLIINPDDLVVTPETHEMLLEDIREYPEFIKVISGVCNINSEPKYAGKVNAVTSHRINPIRDQRTYDWLILKDLNKEDIITATFAGFGYMIIDRGAVERIPFRDDNEVNGNRGAGGAVDVMFCNDCLDAEISIWVDPMAFSNHLSSYNRTLKVGVEPPRTEFVPKRQTITTINP